MTESAPSQRSLESLPGTKGRPLKITFIDNVCDPRRPGNSGHSDIVWSLARKFAEHGHHINIVGPYTRDTRVPFTHPSLTITTFEAHPLADRNSLGMALNVYRAAKACRGRDDYVFTTDAFSAGITGAYLRRTKVVFITSGNIFQRQASDFRLDPVAEASYKAVSFFAARCTHRIVATSHDMKNWWIKTGAQEKRVRFIPLGVTAKEFDRSRSDDLTGNIHLLFVGRLEGENNPEMLVQVAARLEARGVAFEMRIVGDGRLAPTVSALIDRNGLHHRIKMISGVAYRDLPDLYARNDIFLYMRQAGAPPRVVLQALTAGMCVVAFDTSGLEDYVCDERMGHLVPYGDIETFVEQIAHMAANRHEMHQIGQHAKRTATQIFDWEAIYTSYDAEILSGRAYSPRA